VSEGDQRLVGELGSRLREARESLGFSLQQVEEVTRIRLVFLEALEEERFDELPGDVYARGFIRNYAQFLGLDTEELLASFQALRGRSPAYHVPKVLDEPLVPRLASNRWAWVFLTFMLMVLLVVGGWYLYQRFVLGVEPGAIVIPRLMPLGNPTETRPVATGITATATRPPPATTVALPTPLPSSQAAYPAPNSTPTPTATETATNRLLPTLRPTSVPSPSPGGPTRPTPTRPTSILVEAQAIETTWLRVYLDGELVFGNFLQGGQTQLWEAEREVSIRVGNAAGLKLTVNGVEVGSLGEAGEVVEVEYNLDNLPGG